MQRLELNLGSTSAGRSQLAGRTRHATRAQILEAGGNPTLADAPEQLAIGDVQHALEERIGQLHRTALITVAELPRGERGAAEAALVGRLADQYEHPRPRAVGHSTAQ